MNIVSSNEKTSQTNSSALDGYIVEVLHREHYNIMSNESLIEQSLNTVLCIGQPNAVNGAVQNEQAKTVIKSEPNLHPIIKLQPYIPDVVGDQGSSSSAQTVQILDNQNNGFPNSNKPVIYTLNQVQSQTPTKQNQVIKLANGMSFSTQSGIKLPLTNQQLQQTGDQVSIQQNQSQQPQQLLNLVLVTDGVNGGVSYLSLVPQN